MKPPKPLNLRCIILSNKGKPKNVFARISLHAPAKYRLKKDLKKQKVFARFWLQLPAKCGTPDTVPKCHMINPALNIGTHKKLTNAFYFKIQLSTPPRAQTRSYYCGSKIRGRCTPRSKTPKKEGKNLWKTDFAK